MSIMLRDAGAPNHHHTMQVSRRRDSPAFVGGLTGGAGPSQRHCMPGTARRCSCYTSAALLRQAAALPAPQSVSSKGPGGRHAAFRIHSPTLLHPSPLLSGCRNRPWHVWHPTSPASPLAAWQTGPPGRGARLLLWRLAEWQQPRLLCPRGRCCSGSGWCCPSWPWLASPQRAAAKQGWGAKQEEKSRGQL